MESKTNGRVTLRIHMNQSMTECVSFIMICILVYTCTWNIQHFCITHIVIINALVNKVSNKLKQ